MRGVKFEWAFLLDALKTERDQGITIDTTQIFFKTKKRNFVFIDAPGHKEFLQNMITGATTADLAFLIIDVNEGVKEQTKKHIYLLNLIGVRNVMVLVNKMDLVEYSQLKFEEIKKKINVYISKIGIQAINIVPISATKGDNIVKKSKYMPWYKKQTVIQSLESIEILNLSAELPLRIPVQDIYKINNKRIIVGRIESGNLDANQKILFSPSNTVVNLKKVEKWKDKSKTKYQAGECIGLVLEEEVFAEKGNLISDVQKPPTITNNFNARIFWFSNRSLVINNKYKLKLNTCDYEVSFLKILRVIETESLREKKTLNVEKNDEGRLIFKLESLASVNNFKVENSHEAISDVLATKDLLRLVKNNEPTIFKNFFQNTNKLSLVKKIVENGKTYFVINDYTRLRSLFGELLREVQRIKSEGDYEAGKNLIEKYGVKVDKELHAEILKRNEKFNTAPYSGFINPELVPVLNDSNEIIDIKIVQPKDFATQMLDYAKKYTTLPDYN